MTPQNAAEWCKKVGASWGFLPPEEGRPLLMWVRCEKREARASVLSLMPDHLDWLHALLCETIVNMDADHAEAVAHGARADRHRKAG